MQKRKNNSMPIGVQKLWSDESGATLVIAVLTLVALTIIGLGAVTSSNIAMSVSGNLKAKSTAYHAAEACLYYQIKRIQDSGSGTTDLNFDLGNGLDCTATAPVSAGGISSTGEVLDGYSLEVGSEQPGFSSYEFVVVGNGPRNTTATIEVGINLPAFGGGY